jgi:ParB family chromosome partitioning protein
VAVLQLVENVQRVDLSQLDLFNALSALREQGLSHKQIAGIMGKSVQYVDNLFTGINEIQGNERLIGHITTAGGSIQDVAETKGIPDEERFPLLEQRRKGELTRNEMRDKARELKQPRAETAAETSLEATSSHEDKPWVRIVLRSDCRQINLIFENFENDKPRLLTAKDLGPFLAERGMEFVLEGGT